MRVLSRDDLIERIASAIERENPGWNTAPARREIVALMLDAMPDYTTKLDDGRWVPAVGRYAFDRTMETLNRVEKERMAALVKVGKLEREVTLRERQT